jgi:hypothetical protein
MPGSDTPDIPILPTSFDPDDSQRLERILRRPAGVGHSRHSVETEQRFEGIEPSQPLDPALSWFYLGFAYALIRVDRSLFEAYQDALGKNIAIRSYRADYTLVPMQGSKSWSTNPWSGTIQGIEASHAKPFIDYIASFLFRRQDSGQEWTCGFMETMLQDPFSGPGQQVAVWVACPTNETLKRQVQVTSGLLGHPVCSIVSLESDT